MDDDVMDQQKFAVSDTHCFVTTRPITNGACPPKAAAVVLASALVDMEADMSTHDPDRGHVLPSMPLHKAKEVMTRSDFIRSYDRLNLFSITSDAQVRASSVPMYRAFKELVAEPGFRKHLQDTIDRISAIESLGRTRELVAKDLVLGGRYEIRKAPGGTQVTLSGEEEKEEK